VDTTIGVTLLLLGLGLALVSVFAWRSSIITGSIGVVLSGFCAVWLLRTIDTFEGQSAWASAPMTLAQYEALLVACGAVAVAGALYGISGVVSLVRSRRRAVASVPERAVTAGTQVCRHCGKRVPAKAIACKYCERDLHPRS
jgi:ribosomal protein L40E